MFLVPETVGLAVATGALVMIAVEAVNWVVVPTELVATTRARRYLPTFWTPGSNEVDCRVSTGVALFANDPVPNWPRLPFPQQRILPELTLAHE